MKIEEDVPGTGEEAVNGKMVVVRYVGYLNQGDKFQEVPSYSFRLGSREVIASLEHATP